jgi:hypothetical protein
MLVPKLYRIRHNILQLLTDKRSEQQLHNLHVEKSQLTIEEISTLLQYSIKSVDQQLNVLWENGEVQNVIAQGIKNNHYNTKYMVLSKGISTASSKAILNEGKAINAQLFNNYSSGLFQIIAGIIAIWTIVQNTTSIAKLEIQSENLKTITKEIQKDINRSNFEIEVIMKTKKQSKIAN